MQNIRSRRGFTLIELLVVVAIIALLAAILFPVFGRARENARRSGCQNNLKQIGLGIMQYTQDFDERMPNQVWGLTTSSQGADIADYSSGSTSVNGTPTATGRNWIVMVEPYVKSWAVYRCPSAVDITGAGGYNPSGNSNTAYFMNGVAMQDVTGGVSQARTLASMQDPSSLILVHENRLAYSHVFIRPWYITTPTAGWYEAMYGATNDTGKVHFNGGNLLFCDGHVKWRAQAKICVSDFGLPGTACGAPLL